MRFCCSNASAFLFVTDWLDSQEVNIMNDHILFIPLITFMGERLLSQVPDDGQIQPLKGKISSVLSLTICTSSLESQDITGKLMP